MGSDEFGDPAVTRAKHSTPVLADAGGMQVEVPRLQLAVRRVGSTDAPTTRTFDGDVCRVGSHPSNDLALDDRTVSRFHCRISRGPAGEWLITDTGSTNGTRVDGVKIMAAELGSDAVIVVGDTELWVQPASRRLVRVPASARFGALVGDSAVMQRLYAVLERVAASDIDVLIHGESGTGKELVATELVQRSARADGPVVVVDCSAISPALVESELFGHVRGAFTGADRDRQGAFQAASGGTLFLDEIGELPLELQPKLLRALEAREVRRVGETHSQRVDVRVLAATNRDLEREINRGCFREDLYYRLAKVAVRLPSLRDRTEDIPLLVQSFLTALGPSNGARLFSDQVVKDLARHDWPGNVRELKNYVERCVVLEDASMPARRDGAKVDETGTEDVPFRVAKEAAVAAFEKAYLGPLLLRCEGNVSKAARAAQMDRMYLHQLAQKYGFR
jgi:DNA-binding NtrC family response regulator